MIKQVWLKRHKQERTSHKRTWFADAWGLIDVEGNDVVQPWFTTMVEAAEFAMSEGWDFSGIWHGPWQVVERAGSVNERVIGTCATYDDAYCATRENYAPEEHDELGIDIMKNGSTEY
jgi:hypothetical protein